MLHTPSSTLEFTLHSPDSSNPLPLSNTFLSRGRAQGESAHFPGTYMLSALVQDGADCLGKAALCRAGWARLSGMSQSLGGFYSQSGLDNTKPMELMREQSPRLFGKASHVALHRCFAWHLTAAHENFLSRLDVVALVFNPRAWERGRSP